MPRPHLELLVYEHGMALGDLTEINWSASAKGISFAEYDLEFTAHIPAVGPSLLEQAVAVLENQQE